MRESEEAFKYVALFFYSISMIIIKGREREREREKFIQVIIKLPTF